MYSISAQLQSFYTSASSAKFFFFFMNGNTERAQCALSQVCIPKKRKRKAVKRIKQSYTISKRVIKKNHAIWSTMVIDLPFKGKKVEGSRKYRRERVPKTGSRRKKSSLNRLILALESSTQ